MDGQALGVADVRQMAKDLQAVDKKLRSHFLLSRAELNKLRTMLEKALLESKKTKEKKKDKDSEQAYE